MFMVNLLKYFISRRVGVFDRCGLLGKLRSRFRGYYLCIISIMDTVWILLCMYIVSLPPEEYEIDYRVWLLETRTTHLSFRSSTTHGSSSMYPALSCICEMSVDY
ncbi:hypothetical protein ASPTUDRAFT_48698 [Aspergillus tubingensis CBS 134.48]|uniref:Uncharacterized protein n=1 Tax=Aspergillus tubingensis (strain CBS 134.48) TaxID=767770 RepID=A0A1L9MSD9_ASPTC|nr:hypothetical protein ASPTUDRAFT_48698 [Aspergillus tubingensis CBS 134.48]